MDRRTGRTPHPGQGLRGREEAWPACGLQRGPMHPTFHPPPQRMGCGLDGRCKAVPGESGAQLAAQMGRLRSGEGRASGWWLSRLGLRGEGVAEGPQGLPAQHSAVSARCAAGVCVRDRCVRGGLRSSSLETEFLLRGAPWGAVASLTHQALDRSPQSRYLFVFLREGSSGPWGGAEAKH